MKAVSIIFIASLAFNLFNSALAINASSTEPSLSKNSQDLLQEAETDRRVSYREAELLVQRQVNQIISNLTSEITQGIKTLNVYYSAVTVFLIAGIIVFCIYFPFMIMLLGCCIGSVYCSRKQAAKDIEAGSFNTGAVPPMLTAKRKKSKDRTTKTENGKTVG